LPTGKSEVQIFAEVEQYLWLAFIDMKHYQPHIPHFGGEFNRSMSSQPYLILPDHTTNKKLLWQECKPSTFWVESSVC